MYEKLMATTNLHYDGQIKKYEYQLETGVVPNYSYMTILLPAR